MRSATVTVSVGATSIAYRQIMVHGNICGGLISDDLPSTSLNVINKIGEISAIPIATTGRPARYRHSRWATNARSFASGHNLGAHVASSDMKFYTGDPIAGRVPRHAMLVARARTPGTGISTRAAASCKINGEPDGQEYAKQEVFASGLDRQAITQVSIWLVPDRSSFWCQGPVRSSSAQTTGPRRDPIASATARSKVRVMEGAVALGPPRSFCFVGR